MPRERYRIADLTVDVDAVAVTRDGAAVILPGLSFDLLVALARRAPSVVTADDLIAAVWNGAAVSDETLTQRVALLRRALGDDAKNPRYVRAVRGRGYQLAAEVTALSEPESEAASLPEPQRRAKAFPAIFGAVLIAIGIAALIVFLQRRPPSAATTLTASPTPSVQELLDRAGSYLRRHQEPNNELAIELYRRALDREPDNPQALAGLSLALGQRATKFNRHSGESDQAVELAERALRRDPRLGLAHHALALALDSKGQVSKALAAYLRAADLEPEPAAALASAANLLQVQGHLAQALETNLRAAQAAEGKSETPVYLEVQMGATLAALGYDQAAAVWFERALELRPDNVFAALAYARMRLSQSRPREADEIAAQAIRRGIRRPELAAIRGDVALLGGDEKAARSFYQEALSIAPGFPDAETHLLLLDRRDAGSASRPDLETRYREALTGLRQGRAEGDEWPRGALDEALLAAGFGDATASLHALDTAIDLGERNAESLSLDPMLAALRQNPAFALRIERIRSLVAAERQRVAGAAWLPPSLLSGGGARKIAATDRDVAAEPFILHQRLAIPQQNEPIL
jgi:DNA-binding winged helix-turn-helix (wHTH) protein/Tfp pilus assembly protein PilF